MNAEARANLLQAQKAFTAQAEASLESLRTTAPPEMVPTVERIMTDRTAFLAAHQQREAATAAGDRAKEAEYDAQASKLAGQVNDDFNAMAKLLSDDAAAQRAAVASAASRRRGGSPSW